MGWCSCDNSWTVRLCKLVPRGHNARLGVLEKFALLTLVYISRVRQHARFRGHRNEPGLWAKIQINSLRDLLTNPLERQNCPEFPHFVILDLHVSQLLETQLTHPPEAQMIRTPSASLGPGSGSLGHPVSKTKLGWHVLCIPPHLGP